ncbi:MAG: TIGR00725 family protein [Micrococcales bacterium]|nr:MAG: TIGR00725 family protein [Micrococcales bacterium]PIE25769.1 MAG: TIGR00725 family protein [Micrococcales bacterium]PIE26596.1 MAG: TIGR00725 family protein [Micrococcales bacterium]
MPNQHAYVGVIGPGEAQDQHLQAAYQVGRLLAERGVVVVTGGLGGVMHEASKGAAEALGLTVGLLPGPDRSAASRWVTVAIPTGLGEMRNALLVRSCDAIVAVGCSWGTLSEIALAVRTGVPVIALDCWQLPNDGPIPAADPHDAVAAVDRVLRRYE